MPYTPTLSCALAVGCDCPLSEIKQEALPYTCGDGCKMEKRREAVQNILRNSHQTQLAISQNILHSES